MPVLRAAAVVVAAAVVAAACGSPEMAAPADPRIAAAGEYAVSARRALQDTRFDILSDREVAAWVVEVCDVVPGAAGIGAAVRDVLTRIGAPAGPAVDDEIMAVVLGEGAIAVCPGEVDAAALREWTAAGEEDRFLEAVAAVSPVIESPPAAGDLLEAGRLVCATLDAGGSVEEALAAELEALFGVSGPFEEIPAGRVGDREGMVAGGVLGAASSILCPRHREAVAAYVGRPAGQDS